MKEWIDISLSPRFKGEEFYLTEFITTKGKMLEDIVKKYEGMSERERVWELFKFVVENIKYPIRDVPQIALLIVDTHVLFRHPLKPKLSLVLFDFWKFPYETLRDGLGDCEDTSFLLCSLLRIANVDAWAVLGKVVIDDVPYGHAWVEYRSPEYGSVILETTFESLDGFGSLEEYVEYERYVRDMYKPEIKFNESEVVVVKSSIVRELKKRFKK